MGVQPQNFEISSGGNKKKNKGAPKGYEFALPCTLTQITPWKTGTTQVKGLLKRMGYEFARPYILKHHPPENGHNTRERKTKVKGLGVCPSIYTHTYQTLENGVHTVEGTAKSKGL